MKTDQEIRPVITKENLSLVKEVDVLEEALDFQREEFSLNGEFNAIDLQLELLDKYNF
jgi:hypothetical protein